jgi:hypothetical protein
MTKWRMDIACWRPNATNTHSSCVIFLLFHLREGASVGRYMYIACLLSDQLPYWTSQPALFLRD